MLFFPTGYCLDLTGSHRVLAAQRPPHTPTAASATSTRPPAVYVSHTSYSNPQPAAISSSATSTRPFPASSPPFTAISSSPSSNSSLASAFASGTYAPYASPEQIAIILQAQQQPAREREREWVTYITTMLSRGWIMYAILSSLLET